MKKMISASIALLVMEEPQVGPTVVMLILSFVVFGMALAGTVVVETGVDVVVEPAAAPALAVVVVVGLAVVVVVGGAGGACAAGSAVSAFCTFLLTTLCCADYSLLMFDCTVS